MNTANICIFLLQKDLFFYTSGRKIISDIHLQFL